MSQGRDRWASCLDAALRYSSSAASETSRDRSVTGCADLTGFGGFSGEFGPLDLSQEGAPVCSLPITWRLI